MKFSENSLVVDVIKISNSSYKLSVPAGDLLTAAMNGAVLRRHDLSTAAVPNVLYVPLSESKLSSGTYTFTFASGDAFTASAADAYPAASSVSDETGGGSGGGANNIVHVDYTHEKTSSGDTWTLTKTAGEILSLMKSGNIVFIQVDTDEYYQLAGVQRLGANSQVFQFPCIDPNPTSQSNLTYPKIVYKKVYQANGLTAYPTYVANSGGNAD